MSLVKTQQFNHIHYYAQCDECNFDAGISMDGGVYAINVRQKARTHVARTGHTVVLSSGKETVYSAVSKETK